MRNRCNSEALSAYLDGALSSRRARSLEGHLRACDHCREELAALRRVGELFRAWEPEAPRAFFVERLNHRLDGVAESRALLWSRWAVWRFAPAALAAASVGALVFLLHRELGPEPVTVDAYLNRSLDGEVLEVATASESDLSREWVLDLVLAGGGR